MWTAGNSLLKMSLKFLAASSEQKFQVNTLSRLFLSDTSLGTLDLDQTLDYITRKNQYSPLKINGFIRRSPYKHKQNARSR